MLFVSRVTDLAKMSLTELFNFGFHSVRLPLLPLDPTLPLAEVVVNERDRASSDQRLQTVWVAAQPAEHAQAPAAGVLVLGEVEEQAGHDARTDQGGAGVGGVGEA